MAWNDKVAAMLSCAVYSQKVDKEEYEKYIPEGWKEKDIREHPDSGLFCGLYVKVRARK